MATSPAYSRQPNPFLVGAPQFATPNSLMSPLALENASRRRPGPGAKATGRVALPRGEFGVQPPSALQQSISENTVQAQLAARKQRKKTAAASAGRVTPSSGAPTSLSMPILTPVSLVGI